MPFLQRRNPFSEPSFDVFVPARRNDPLGIIEGVALEGNKRFVPWIGVSTIRELALKHADKTHLVDADELALAKQHLAATEELLAQAQHNIDQLEAQQARISGLARDGYKVQKIQGRPKVRLDG